MYFLGLFFLFCLSAVDNYILIPSDMKNVQIYINIIIHIAFEQAILKKYLVYWSLIHNLRSG
jgi:hypothetical protein